MTNVTRRPRIEGAVQIGGWGPTNDEVFAVITREDDDGYCNYPFPSEETARRFAARCAIDGIGAKVKSSSRGVIYAPEVAHTLTSGISNTTGVNSSGRRQEDDHNIVVPLDIRQASRSDGATGVGTPGTGVGEEGAPSYAVTTGPPPAVGIYVKSKRAQTNEDDETWVDREVSPTLNPFDTGDARATVGVITPVEPGECGCCPHDPKPDSARYRTMGNAVTVDVIAWIGHRLMREFAS